MDDSRGNASLTHTLNHLCSFLLLFPLLARLLVINICFYFRLKIG